MLMKVGSRISCSLSIAQTERRVRRRRARGAPLRPVVDLDATLPLGQRTRLRPAAEVLPMRCLRCQGPVEKGTAPVCLEGAGVPAGLGAGAGLGLHPLRARLLRAGEVRDRAAGAAAPCGP